MPILDIGLVRCLEIKMEKNLQFYEELGMNERSLMPKDLLILDAVDPVSSVFIKLHTNMDHINI